ncbi:MAG: cohesin domain-containing protein [Candidatus Hydrogenedentes bacterium]|nr:cohesin domain-containing protein [Candidatus Hydrogenedentota bacterium]
MRPWLVVAVTVVIIPSVAQAQGTLRIGDPTVESNQVTIPVYLNGNVGSGVAAMDFRVNYDPNVLRPLSAGAGSAAADADKRVMANETASGEYVVVMMGMNQTTFTSGEVARIVMERTPGANPSQWKLGLSRPTLSGTDGTIIDSAVAPYAPNVPTDKPKGSTDATPDKPDTKNSTDTAPKPGVANAPVNVAQQLEVPTFQARRANRSGSDAKSTATAGERALKQLTAAFEARDEARGAIDTPSAERRDAARGTEKAGPAETTITDAKVSVTDPASANDEAKPARLAAIQTVESMRSNPEGRGTASRTGTGNGSAGAAWKAIVAGIAAGVVVAVLSLVLLRRKVFG